MFSDSENTDTLVEAYDLDQILQAGELIAGTLSGPDTYFEYRGRGFGLQYELAEDFARSIGTRLRIEVAHDSAELVQWLRQGQVDLVAMPMPPTRGTLACKGQWLVGAQGKELAEAINRWHSPDRQASLQQQRKRQRGTPTVRRRPRPAIQNSALGIISPYDAILQRHAAQAGWDWRLLAAQCYQESAFDPKAESWAGAQGLMQIMPGTASLLGVSDVWNPEENIAAGVRYLRELSGKFHDVSDRHERLCFALAAYNGGTGHVRDAMALARKHGKNPYLWREVSPYILLLEQPRFYRDPVVKYGYLRGSETEGYVRGILDRWRMYCGQVRHASPPRTTPTKGNPLVRGRELFPADSI